MSGVLISGFKECWLYVSRSVHDPRTAIVCFVLLILFTYYVSKLIQIWLCRRAIRRIRKSNALLEGLLNDSRTKKLAQEYKLGICIGDENDKKTNELAESFFNSNSLIIACRINRQAMSAAAGMLVGIGVLGTFLGLSYSVTGFDTSTSEKILDSIQRLLPGMGTAFFTSLAGMILSSLYILCEKIVLSMLSKEVANVAESLNELYYIADAQVNEKMLEKIIRNFSSLDESGNVWLPGNMLYRMYSFSERQTAALENLTEEFYENATSKAVKPLLDEVNRATSVLAEKIDSLAQSVQAPGDNMVNGVINDLRDSIREMVRELKDYVAHETSDKIDALGDEINVAIKAIEMLPESLKIMSDNLKENVRGLTENIDSSIRQMEQVVTTINNNSAEMGRNLVVQQSEANTSILAMVNSFKAAIKDNEMVLKQFEKTISEIQKLQDSTSNVASEMNDASQNISKSISNLKLAQQSFVVDYKQSADLTKGTFENIGNKLKESDSSMKQIVDASKGVADSFIKLKAEMVDVFNQYEEGLLQYRNAVASNTKEILSEYTDAVKKAVDSLGGAIDQLQDTLEDFNISPQK